VQTSMDLLVLRGQQIDGAESSGARGFEGKSGSSFWIKSVCVQKWLKQHDP
jgi:hypothetical protein